MVIIKNFKLKNRFSLFNKTSLERIKLLYSWKYFSRILILILFFFPFTIGAYQISRKSVSYLPLTTKRKLATFLNKFNITGEVIEALPYLPSNYIKGLISNPKILEINIKYKNFAKLKEGRDNALEKGVLLPEDSKYTKGSLSYNGKNYPIRLRLKGDNLDHLRGNKWSYRIKVLDNKSILGMKKFSLQVPEVRNFLGEPIFQKLLDQEGIPNLRYEVVSLKINGKNLGIYTIEEHFDKFLIENNLMREGIVISLNESSYWIDQIRENAKPIDFIEDYFMERDIKVFDSKRLINNQILQSQASDASLFLRKFLDGEMKVSEVFDLEKIAKYFAIVDLAGASHATHWNNMRFIYNPINKLLVPVGFDADAGNFNRNLSIKSSQMEIFFRDKEFMREYIKHLERLSQEDYLEEFFKENKVALNKYLNKFYRSYPWIDSYSESIFLFKSNQAFIRERLNPVLPIKANLLGVYDSKIEIELINRSNFPLLINGLKDNEKIIYRPNEKLIIPSRNYFKTPNIKLLNFPISKELKNIDKNNLKISYSILGSSLKKETKVRDNIYPNKYLSSEFITKMKPNSEDFEFLIHDYKNNKITIKEGNWIIKKPLIIPKGFTVYAKNSYIELIDNGIILSRSHLIFKGSKNKPIEINSKDTAMGLVVLNAKNISQLDYVKFSGLSTPESSKWSLTGAVTFFRSPVIISNSEFSSNRSEDSLNIINGSFNIKNTIFKDTKSDALDVDFGYGSMQNVSFKEIGNDAIDISGTELEMKNIFINDANDKAISIGEKSNMFANNIFIKGASIGIASKDLSRAEINNLEIDSTQLGFAIYQKKDEFGPASISVKTKSFSKKDPLINTKLENINSTKLYLLESPSSLSINDFFFKPNVELVKDYLYGEIYGTKTVK